VTSTRNGELSLQRPYRGVTPEERVSQRHEALLEAGLEVFGTTGYASSSVRSICDVAQLNQRYFYESFESREDVLLAVYEWLVTDQLERIARAIDTEDGPEQRIRAGLRAWWEPLVEDVRKARILALEVVGVSERVERRRREFKLAFTQFLIEQAVGSLGPPSPATGVDLALLARGLTASNLDMVADWLRGAYPGGVDELVEQGTRMFMLIASAAFPDTLPPWGA
jgi:AcrR family transcriptional regulator